MKQICQISVCLRYAKGVMILGVHTNTCACRGGFVADNIRVLSVKMACANILSVASDEKDTVHALAKLRYPI